MASRFSGKLPRLVPWRAAAGIRPIPLWRVQSQLFRRFSTLKPENSDELVSKSEKVDDIAQKTQAEKSVAKEDPKKKHQWLSIFEKLGLIEQRNKETNVEKLADARADLRKKRLEKKRPQSSIELLKMKFGAKKAADASQIHSEVERIYKHRWYTGRHWKVEEWMGIPVRYWIFIYLGICGVLLFAFLSYINTARDLSHPKVAHKAKYKHVKFVIQQLNANPKLNELIGEMTDCKVSKLTPADRNNFRSRFVTEVWAEAAEHGIGQVRVLLIYGDERSLEALQRIEIHLDTEIIKVEILERDLSAFDVIECPPDLFPLMEWWTITKREMFQKFFQYVWPIAPFIGLAAMARWHFRSPPGLANYMQMQLKNHVVVKRSLGQPVYLQADGWRGKMTSRSCNVKVLLEGRSKKGTVHVVGYRDGAERWLFPNCVLMLDNVKHDVYREIQLPPFNIPKPT